MNLDRTSTEKEHGDGKDCWCQPTLYYVSAGDTPIWIHSDDPRDRREPSAAFMIDVIAELAWSEHDPNAA